MNGWAALADIGVDVVVDLTLNGDGESYGDAAVYCLSDQVRGIVIRSLHGNATVGRLCDQAGSAPLIAVKPHIQAAIGGGGMHVPGQIIETESTGGCFGINYANYIRKLDAAVHRAQLGANMTRHTQTEVDIPAATRQAPHLWSFGM